MYYSMKIVKTKNIDKENPIVLMHPDLVKELKKKYSEHGTNNGIHLGMNVNVTEDGDSK